VVNLHFPMGFPMFSQFPIGFPMVFLWVLNHHHWTYHHFGTVRTTRGSPRGSTVSSPKPCSDACGRPRTKARRWSSESALKRRRRSGRPRGLWKNQLWHCRLPSGKLSHNYGKSPFSMGKSTISMVIFNSYVKLPEGNRDHCGNPYDVFFSNNLLIYDFPVIHRLQWIRNGLQWISHVWLSELGRIGWCMTTMLVNLPRWVSYGLW